MQKSKVQPPRDSNRQWVSKPSTSSFSTVSSPESERFFKIEHGLPLRNQDYINRIAKNHRNLETTRAQFFHENSGKEVNVYEFSLDIKTDAKFIWKLCETSFPEFDRLDPMDKKTLFYNFYTKWNVLEIAMLCIKFNDPYNFYTPLGAVAKSIIDFYGDTVRKEKVDGNLTGDGIRQVFQPLWNFHFDYVIPPLAAMKFGEVENMALFGILLWDPAYTNINESLSTTCHGMRKIIMRELNSYFEKDERRFFDTLDILGLIERAEHKCKEEIELCGVYNFEIDEEMRTLVMWDNY